MNNKYLIGKDDTSFNIAFLFDHIEPSTLYILEHPTIEDIKEINNYEGYYFEYFLHNVDYNCIIEFLRDDEDFNLFQYDPQFKTIYDIFHAIYQFIISHRDLNITDNIKQLIDTFHLHCDTQKYTYTFMESIFVDYLEYREYIEKYGEDNRRAQFIKEFETCLKTETMFKTFLLTKYRNTYIDCDSSRAATLLDLKTHDVIDAKNTKIVYIKSLKEYIKLNKQVKKNSEQYQKYFKSYIDEQKAYNKIMSKLSEVVKDYIDKNPV